MIRKGILFIKNLSSKTKALVVFSIIILLAIWFLLPLLAIGNNYIFDTVNAKMIVTALYLAGIVLWLMILFFLKHQDKTLTVMGAYLKKVGQWGKQWAITLGQYLREYYHELHDRIRSDQKRRRIKRLPWYLILGSPHSGRHHLIQNSGLYFQRPEHIGEEAIDYINQFPDFEWWFSEQAILIDVMRGKAEKNESEWKKFIKLLKRERKHKPLNGIILNFPMPNLFILSNQDRQEFIAKISLYIRDLYSTFKSYVPIYVIFNKCDQLEGFMEFFENLSKEELNQVWGITLPIQDCNDIQTALNFFNKEYSQLIEQLRKRVMWAMDMERTMRGRELINGFPQQMQLFRKPIENLMSELFGATRYHKAVQLRGIYFVSGTQGQGESYDFLLRAMSKKFQLVPPQFKRPVRVGESYFIRSLLFEVFLPEAGILGDSERRKKIRYYLYRSLLLGFPLIVLALAIGMQVGYETNLQNLRAVENYINDYNTHLSNLQNNDPSVVNTLPVISTLQHARLLYTNTSNVGVSLLLASGHIKNTLIQTEQRALHSLFLPRIAAAIEQQLNQNIKDQNLVYADLKGYLAFSDGNTTPREAIKAPTEFTWDQDYANDPKTADKLKFYLTMALENPVDKLPLDQTLIDRLRDQLAQIIPADRAYGLLTLRGSVDPNPNIILNSTVGNGFDRVFKGDDSVNKIPALYTAAGYKNVFLTQYHAIATEISNDNYAIGLSSNADAKNSESYLRDALEETYNKNYTVIWQQALNRISIRPFNTLNDAVDTLNALVGKSSPLQRLLTIVYDNTHDLDHAKINVANTFEPINRYTQHSGGNASWKDTVKILTDLRNTFKKLQQASDQNKASFDQVQAVLIRATDNPMQKLLDEANNAPPPIKAWLKVLADNCWKILLKGAHDQMNAAWSDQILATYNTNARERYPFNPHSDSDVTIDAFNNLFSTDGALDRYFGQYIKPFVNVGAQPWKLNTVNGLTIEIPPSDLELFQRVLVIQKQFFPNGAKTAQLNITLKPLTLDTSAQTVQFSIGDQDVDYSHGRQTVTSVTWPLPFTTEDSRIVLTNFDGDQFGHHATGPWSLFKLFSTGEFKPGRDAGSYLFVLDFGGYRASFAISGPNDLNVFTLKNLKGFSLPQTIAPSLSDPQPQPDSEETPS